MSEMDGDALDPPLRGYLEQHFALEWEGIHGAPHWARVRVNGLELAERTGASRRVVSLFAFLHDSCRANESHDPQHGARACDLIAELRDRFLSISDEEAQLLALACRDHSAGLIAADVTVQTCWDADRLDLGRVGTKPDARLLCTEAARQRAMIERAYRRSLGRR
jgi:uncharacterized protein